ncbi:MAG: radical SAM protein [Anaerolineae bacterium]|nr:radical SAM protein [Anaerolineae bacterium]MDH7475595.1 radical SAM protein [Anaerolineae bacterium]
MENERLMAAWQTRVSHFPMEIEFDYPLDTALISLTGSACALDCAHCGRRYLQHMVPIWQAEVNKATSCLISGGCDADGRVPVTEHLARVAALRNGRRLNWHVGLITEEDLQAIAPLADMVSFDFVGDDETIREVYGLHKTVADYVACYQLLRRYVPVTPHITIGLRGGELGHEMRALELLANLGMDSLVLLVFIPTPGTRYADRHPPDIAAALDVIIEARLRFPDTPLWLGCMRPHGHYRQELDPLAVRAGVNKIVSPARQAVHMAEELGLAVRRGRECCALIGQPVTPLQKGTGLELLI